jgi:hypothetical protein
MRALTTLVAVMAVLIVIATAAVVVGIAEKFGARHTGAVAGATIAVPRGARLEAVTSSDNRLILALLLADGSRQLLVIDLKAGRKLATIVLQPTP